jgi:hypothetical protein
VEIYTHLGGMPAAILLQVHLPESYDLFFQGLGAGEYHDFTSMLEADLGGE